MLNPVICKKSVESSGTSKKDNVVPQIITSDMFNEYFSNIGPDLTKSMSDPGNLSWNNPVCLYSFSRFHLNQLKSCLENIMKYLPLDSNLDSKMPRLAAALLTPSIARILNNPRISGKVPQDWKITRVTLVYKVKNGDKRERSDCRPI